ncbi:MAG: AMP-binding protein, partial [Micrococcales bacterium]|nr:AMP-binding protein [Micrococcales bacterium]
MAPECITPPLGQPPAGDTIRDLLRRSVRRIPSATALRFEDRDWTYRELESAVHRTARRLEAAGISPGDRVAAFGTNSDAFAILFLACASMGAVHVPVNFALKGEELRHILRDADVALIAADPSLLGLAEEAAADLTRERGAEALAVWPLLPADEQREASVLETASEASLGEEAPSVEIAPENLAQLLYTSGTTSAPKGAMMTHRALVAEYLSAVIALDLCAEDRPLVAMPPDERWGEAITAVIVVHPD